MSTPTTPSRPDGLASRLKALRNPSRVLQRPTSPGTGVNRPTLTRSNSRDTRSRVSLFGSRRSASAASSTGNISETGDLASPYDRSSVASSPRLRRRSSNFSRHSISDSIRRLPFLDPSSPHQAEAAPAALVARRGPSPSPSVSSLRRHAGPSDSPELKTRRTLSNWARKSFDRRSSVSSPPFAARSPSRGPADSGAESDNGSLGERERRWGVGLPVLRAPTPKKSEENIKRRFVLGRRHADSVQAESSIEPASEANKLSRPTWVSKMLRVGPKPKKEKDIKGQPSEQRPIPAILRSPIAPTGRVARADPIPRAAAVPPVVSPTNAVIKSHVVARPGAPVSDTHEITALNRPLHPSGVTLNQSLAEVLEHLSLHGCDDVTDKLDISKSGPYPIAAGGYGDVYRGEFFDGNQVAIKCLRQYADSNDVDKQLKHAARELYVWSKCSHPNVLGLIGVAKYRGQIAMISPWMEYCNVRRLLTQNPEVDRYTVCFQISDGVQYLHKRGIVHGDLKGDNIMCTGDLVPKLTDFGNAALKQYTLQFSKTSSGTGMSLNWVAPEVLKVDTGLTVEADIWSLGMTILEVVTGKIPYHGLIGPVVIMKIMQSEHPTRPEEHLPSQVQYANLLWSLLQACWAQSPKARPSCIEVRNKLEEIISTRSTGSSTF